MHQNPSNGGHVCTCHNARRYGRYRGAALLGDFAQGLEEQSVSGHGKQHSGHREHGAQKAAETKTSGSVTTITTGLPRPHYTLLSESCASPNESIFLKGFFHHVSSQRGTILLVDSQLMLMQLMGSKIQAHLISFHLPAALLSRPPYQRLLLLK